LDVLWHDGNSLGVDGAQVGVFEETNQVGFRGLLEGSNSGSLEAEIRLEVLSDFSDESLEGELSDEELSRLLVATDFSQSDGSGSESVGLLDSSRSGATNVLACSLGGDGLAWGLASSGLTSGLLGTSH